MKYRQELDLFHMENGFGLLVWFREHAHHTLESELLNAVCGFHNETVLDDTHNLSDL
jgi:hypothetical protein